MSQGARSGEAARNAPAPSLRDWLDHLSAEDLLAIARPGVALRFELAAIAKRLDGVKAALFPAPSGHAMPVVSGLVSRREWIAAAMGVSPREMLARFLEATLHPLPWREVDRAPAQARIHREVDLEQLLPLPTHNEQDSGPYITAGLLIARNPKTGIQNVAIHRLQLSGKRRLGALLLPRHTNLYFEAAEAEGKPLPVAIVIGVDPLTLLASQAVVPVDHDELEIAGALQGRPLDVVKCRTSEIRVPASAEIVLEGRLLANERAPEGPFGEFPQYYGERADRHVIEIDCVTMREDAVFHTIVGGGLEHLLLGAVPREASLLAQLRRSSPGVRDVRLSEGGVCRYHLHVQMKKRNEGEAKNLILGAFAAHYDIKQVIVVDEDVDIHDPREVEWAVATRAQADRDLVIVAGAQGSRLDPSAKNGISAKLGIDATIPLDAPPLRFTRIRVPGEGEVDLSRALEPAAGDWRKRAWQG